MGGAAPGPSVYAEKGGQDLGDNGGKGGEAPGPPL